MGCIDSNLQGFVVFHDLNDRASVWMHAELFSVIFGTLPVVGKASLLTDDARHVESCRSLDGPLSMALLVGHFTLSLLPLCSLLEVLLTRLLLRSFDDGDLEFAALVLYFSM